mmetsp:Transcript_26727/g.72237  ORF Transcript_26727/g.72237 Transcript_26727/m.72237 type:complete len:259 (+) Transcript_26727:146-922(+)|eukprot:CAMPEP_0202351280 /NCGR_PEP_ID=MMETSP1126-20121109/7991_1 /ASSEMBLY_ACC=CAM_ASM_000457 /TAXON_ID=3047 /ORGANISM="Dunaliella tertiolecta, Strain CCMP1320" /LENGTH=258 /DNA_ID=CAMNT_0048943371 /DNA_START=118 /DNA_END=894 /DNA_ORIENTATION=-
MPSHGEELELDTAVRDWVFIPLTLCILLMKLLTQYANMLMHSPSNKPSTKDLKEIREQQLVIRSQRLRAIGRIISDNGFKMRKEFLAAKDTGVFHQKAVSKSMQETMATDPTMMVDMMKKNLSGIVPQLAMGMVVNFFFSGFVLGKVPFALSPRFKLMLQRGIDLASLDVSYFTSLSYYILLLFGLRGVFMLVFRDETVDETEMMRRQMNPMGANPMAFDAEAEFKKERVALAALDHEWEVETAEEKAVQTLKRLSGR